MGVSDARRVPHAPIPSPMGRGRTKGPGEGNWALRDTENSNPLTLNLSPWERGLDCGCCRFFGLTPDFASGAANAQRRPRTRARLQHLSQGERSARMRRVRGVGLSRIPETSHPLPLSSRQRGLDRGCCGLLGLTPDLARGAANARRRPRTRARPQHLSHGEKSARMRRVRGVGLSRNPETSHPLPLSPRQRGRGGFVSRERTNRLKTHTVSACRGGH